MMSSYRSVVVLGAARSGTKFFRGVLAAPEWFRATPFDCNHIWRIGNASAPDDQLDPSRISPRQAHVIGEALRKLACPDAALRGSCVMVEKTVSNALRPGFVEHVLPDARYIVLIRDGRDAVESTYRMWMAPPDGTGLCKKLGSLPPRALPYAVWYGMNLISGKLRGRGVGVWGVRYRGIDQDLARLSVPEVCAHQWRCCVEESLAFARRIPPSRLIQVRYEQLIADDAVLEELAGFLELGSTDRERMRAEWRKVMCAPGKSRWTSTFDEPVRRKILDVIAPLQMQLGYPAC